MVRPAGALPLITGVLVASVLLLTPLALPQLQQLLRRCTPPDASGVGAPLLYWHRQHAPGARNGAAGNIAPAAVPIQDWLDAAAKDMAARNAAVSKECSSEVGEALLQEWAGTAKPFCTAQQPGGPGTNVDCMTMLANGHWWSLCEAAGPMLVGPPDPGSTAVPSNENAAGTPALRLGCQPAGVMEADSDEAFGNDSRAASSDGAAAQAFEGQSPVSQLSLVERGRYIDGEAAEVECAASAHIIKHPVLIIRRYDVTNAFHFSEDLVTTFISLALLQRRAAAVTKPADAAAAASAPSDLDPADGAAAPAHPAAGTDAPADQQSSNDDDWTAAQLAIVGDAQAGPFLEIWQRLFPAHPIRFLAEDPFPEGACIRRAAYGAQAGASLLSYLGVGIEGRCQSLIQQAMTLFLRAHFGPPSPLPASRGAFPAQGSGSATSGGVVMDNGEVEEAPVLWLSRAVFDNIRPTLLNSWQADRRLTNEPELVGALYAAIQAWNRRSCVFAAEDLPRLPLGGLRRRLLSAARRARGADSGPAGRAVRRLQSDTKAAAAAAAQHERRAAAAWRERGANGTACRPGRLLFRLRTMELSLAPLRTQLEALMSARVLVGLHGAGLANIEMLAPGTGALLEVLPTGTSGNKHYQRMSVAGGQRYRPVDTAQHTIDPGPVADELTSLLDEMHAAHFLAATGIEL